MGTASDMMARSCSTCSHYKEGGRLNDSPSICWDCSMGNGFPFWSKKLEYSPPQDPLDSQVGGRHYKDLTIQPLDFCIANGADMFQKDIVKYLFRLKGDTKESRLQDLEKAQHYLSIYINEIKKDHWPWNSKVTVA